MCGLPDRGAHAQEGEEMKDLSKLTCRIYGYGIFEIFLAQALGPMNGGFGKVELFCPWMDSFCKPAPRWIGRNIPGVTRIWEFFDNKDKVDTWAFFDVGDADIQQDLRAQGRAIFGTGGRQKKDGTPGEYRPAAYCSTPESAFNRILEMNIRASEATSLMELRDDLLNARQELQASWGASFTG